MKNISARHESQTKYIDGNNESTSSNVPNWLSSCETAGNDDNFFAKFRSDRTFLEVVEGSPEVAAIWNLKRLLKNRHFLATLPLIQRSDNVGTPRYIVYIKDPTEPGRLCRLNPTTVRYANNAANCIEFFGPGILAGTAIYEIGAGYGGESKVFNDYATTINGLPITTWTTFDLPSSYCLIRKFLAQFGYSVNIETLDTFVHAKSPSLVISNAALSEMRGTLLES